MQRQRGGSADGEVAWNVRPGLALLPQLRVGKVHSMLRQRKEQVALLQRAKLACEQRQFPAWGELNQWKAPCHLPQCAQTAH
jgi:hypothetical protein